MLFSQWFVLQLSSHQRIGSNQNCRLDSVPNIAKVDTTTQTGEREKKSQYENTITTIVQDIPIPIPSSHQHFL